MFPRSCAFQENLEHAKAFSHLCERMNDVDFVASTQPTPNSDPVTSSNASSDSTLLLSRAIVDVGPAFNVSATILSELAETSRIAESRSRGNDVNRHGDLRGAGNFAHHDEDDFEHSDGSQYESEHREGTPASIIYRDLGMESRAVQTDNAVPDEPTANERARIALADEEPASAVGRTVVDENGDPMNMNEDTVSAFINFVLQGEASHNRENTGLTGNVDIDNSQAEPGTSDSPVPDSEVEENLFSNALRPDMPVAGTVSRQESVVEDLVASNDTAGNDGMDVDVASEHEATRQAHVMIDEIAMAGASGPETLLYLLNRARQETVSPRSSPAPEGIRA